MKFFLVVLWLDWQMKTVSVLRTELLVESFGDQCKHLLKFDEKRIRSCCQSVDLCDDPNAIHFSVDNGRGRCGNSTTVMCLDGVKRYRCGEICISDDSSKVRILSVNYHVTSVGGQRPEPMSTFGKQSVHCKYDGGIDQCCQNVDGCNDTHAYSMASDVDFCDEFETECFNERNEKCAEICYGRGKSQIRIRTARDKSAVVSRSQVQKKSEKSKRSNTASGGTGGVGYELVGQGPKAVKKDDGGYIIPNKAIAQACAKGGYELAGPSHPMVLDDHSLIHDERLRKSKKSYMWFIVVVLVVVATCMSGVFVYAIYLLTAKNELLPSISDQCRNNQTPSIHQHCVYHKRKYPDNCSSTRCDTVLLNWDEINKKFMIDDSNVASINSILDQTPCQDGKWCINSLCVKTSDKRVKEYSALKPVNGKWKNHCKEETCIDDGKRHLQYFAKKCPPTCKDKDIRRIRIGFRSCTDPYPSYDGEFCDNQTNTENIYGALYVTKDCGLCNGPATISESCSLIPKTCKIKDDSPDCDTPHKYTYFPGGTECHSNDNPNRDDICFFRMCLPNEEVNYNTCD